MFRIKCIGNWPKLELSTLTTSDASWNFSKAARNLLMVLFEITARIARESFLSFDFGHAESAHNQSSAFFERLPNHGSRTGNRMIRWPHDPRIRGFGFQTLWSESETAIHNSRRVSDGDVFWKLARKAFKFIGNTNHHRKGSTLRRSLRINSRPNSILNQFKQMARLLVGWRL